MFSKAFNIIIGRRISVPCHGREVVDGLNATDEICILYFMVTVKLSGSQQFYSQISMDTSTHNYDVSLAQELQNNLSNTSRQHGILDHGKHKKYQVKKVGKQSVSCAKQ